MELDQDNFQNQLFEFIKNSKFTRDQLRMVEIYIQELNLKIKKEYFSIFIIAMISLVLPEMGLLGLLKV